MNIPLKKLKNGFSLPVLGFGTSRMASLEGTSYQRNFENDDNKSIIAIRRAIESGIIHIDTAESYADGHVEEIIGQAIKGYNRKKLFIASKVLPDNLTYNALIKSAESSLKRLGVSYLDLYLIHGPNPLIPIKETMQAMDYLIKKSLIKNTGVSNFTLEQLEAAQNSTDNKIVTNQIRFNLLTLDKETQKIVSYCQQNDVLITCYRPLEKGMVLKKGAKFLNTVVKKYKKTPAQIALSWLYSQINVVVLSKMENEQHLEENLGAVNLKLQPEDIAYLKRSYIS